MSKTQNIDLWYAIALVLTILVIVVHENTPDQHIMTSRMVMLYPSVTSKLRSFFVFLHFAEVFFTSISSYKQFILKPFIFYKNTLLRGLMKINQTILITLSFKKNHCQFLNKKTIFIFMCTFWAN